LLSLALTAIRSCRYRCRHRRCQRDRYREDGGRGVLAPLWFPVLEDPKRIPGVLRGTLGGGGAPPGLCVHHPRRSDPGLAGNQEWGAGGSAPAEQERGGRAGGPAVDTTLADA